MLANTLVKAKLQDRIYINKYFPYLYIFGLFGCFASLKVEGFPSLSAFVFPVLYLYSLVIFGDAFIQRDKFFFFKVFFLLFIGITLSSILCYDPVSSIRSIISLVFNFIFAYIIFRSCDTDTFLYIILRTMIISLFISLILLPIKSDLVIYFDPMERSSIIGLPNFKGLYPHKIHAGIYNSIGYLLSLYFYKRTNSLKYYIFSYFFMAAVLASGSSLALTAFIAVFFIPPTIQKLYRVIGKKGLIFVSVFLALVIFLVFYFDVWTYILMLLGRDASLTGRTEIWDFGFRYISAHPLFGGGYDVFFEDDLNAPAQALWSESDYYNAPSFHNGYIQILAETGIIGGTPFLILLFRNLSKSINNDNNIFNSIIILCIIANTAAAILINPNSFFFVFLIYCTFYYRDQNKILYR